ncbi:hypothetical protein N8642_01430 [bacterium]|nr:hypothetical protein [bacterium]
MLTKTMSWSCLTFLVITTMFVRSDLSACSVPVFRYAIERWAPDSYGVVVFHRGPLSEENQSFVDRMDPTKLRSDQFVNFAVTTVDLSQSSEPEAIELWNAQETEVVPWMMVSYPWSRLAQDSAWAGPLTETNVDRVVDSPVRREVARRLLKGDSAVWVLLESGDSDSDERALERLDSRLEHLTSTLELPALNPADIEEGLISIDEDELKIAFSTIRLSREDPVEAFFVRMLLGSEDDLDEYDEPIAFPIFGRGRVLYGLVGEGIAPEVIDEACVFLTGSCSCEVKEQNPGVDLVMSVDWERLVTNHYDIDRELPALSGFVGLSADPAAEGSMNEGSASLPGDVPQKESKDDSSQSVSNDVEEEKTMSPVVFNSLLFSAIFGCGALGAGVFLLRRRPDAY